MRCSITGWPLWWLSSAIQRASLQIFFCLDGKRKKKLSLMYIFYPESVQIPSSHCMTLQHFWQTLGLVESEFYRFNQHLNGVWFWDAESPPFIVIFIQTFFPAKKRNEREREKKKSTLSRMKHSKHEMRHLFFLMKKAKTIFPSH